MQKDGKCRAKPTTETRRSPRALVCARALLKAEGGAATEHLTYDLSAGGARLCGIPRAKVGDRVGLLLHLPGAWVPAVARLLRVSKDESPEFALQFIDMDAASEDTIQDAVVEALADPDRRSVLLLQSEKDREWQGWSWLAPVSPICAAATTPLEAVLCLERYEISVALVGEESASRLAEWKGALPGLTWRALDRAGRLWSIGATRGRRRTLH